MTALVMAAYRIVRDTTDDEDAPDAAKPAPVQDKPLSLDSLAGEASGGFRFPLSEKQAANAVDIKAVQKFISEFAETVFSDDVLSPEAKEEIAGKIGKLEDQLRSLYQLDGEKWTARASLPNKKAAAAKARTLITKRKKLMDSTLITDKTKRPARIFYVSLNNGTLCFINNDDLDMPRDRQVVLLEALQDRIDEELTSLRYQVQSEGGAPLVDPKPAVPPPAKPAAPPVVARAAAVAAAKPKVVLGALRRLKTLEVQELSRSDQAPKLGLRRSELVKNDGYRDAFETIAKCPRNLFDFQSAKCPYATVDVMARRLLVDQSSQNMTKTILLKEDYAAFWIPKRCDDYFIETDPSNKIYSFNDDTLWEFDYPRRPPPTSPYSAVVTPPPVAPTPSVPTPSVPMSDADPDPPKPGRNPAEIGEDSCAYQVKADKTLRVMTFSRITEVGGGGGAMRSDRPEEAKYLWSGNKALGYSLDLDMGLYRDDAAGRKAAKNGAYYRAPLPATPGAKGGRKVATPPSGTMDSEIVYWKKFDAQPADKKNLPADTKPLPPRKFDKTSLYVKKQKGDWKYSDATALRKPRPIGGKVGGRDDAGTVMGAVLQTIGLKAQDGIDLGSATQFAAQTMADPKASKTWKADSADLGDWLDKAVGDKDKARIRTDQEWCHLLGHGDGGSEEYGNFVSGSKHCNTEQLAIETGQRTGQRTFRARLAVKVSAYLLPSDGFSKERKKFSNWERDFLYQLPTVPSQGNDLKKITAELGVIRALLNAYAATPGKPPANPASAEKAILAKLNAKALSKEFLDRVKNVGKLRVPTAPEFKSLDVKARARICRNLMDEIDLIVNLPYPLGYFVRYKIYNVDTEATPVKIFDHVFDAQEESFDYNEYKILETTVRRVVASSIGLAEQSDDEDAAGQADPAKIDPSKLKVDAAALYTMAVNAKIAARRGREQRARADRDVSMKPAAAAAAAGMAPVAPAVVPPPGGAKRPPAKAKAAIAPSKILSTKRARANEAIKAQAVKADAAKRYIYSIGGWSGPGDDD